MVVVRSHLVFDLEMTLERKINHSNEISVFKSVKNEVLDSWASMSKGKNSRWQTAAILVLCK